MKKLRFVLPLALVMLFAFTRHNDPLPLGSAIPKADLRLKDISGKQVSLKESMKTNGLLVMFSCNTCPVVKKYQSRTIAVATEASGKNIGVVLLNSNAGSREKGDGFDDMKDYAQDQGYGFSYLLDEQSVMADLFGAQRTPEVFLFDGKGLLVYHGAIDDNPNSPAEIGRKHLSIALEELAAGKEISRKQTRSVGCTIKRPS